MLTPAALTFAEEWSRLALHGVLASPGATMVFLLPASHCEPLALAIGLNLNRNWLARVVVASDEPLSGTMLRGRRSGCSMLVDRTTMFR